MMINVLSSFSKTKSVASASSFPFFEKDVLRRIGHLISSDLRHLVQNMGSDAGCAENILDGNASNGERVTDERTVASPGNGLGAHDGDRPLRGERDEPAQPVLEIGRLHIIGESSERGVSPAAIQRRIGARAPQSPEGLHMPIVDPAIAKDSPQRIPVKLRMMPGTWDGSDIDQLPDPICPQNSDKLIQPARRMADGEEGYS